MSKNFTDCFPRIAASFILAATLFITPFAQKVRGANDEETVEFHGPDVHSGYPDVFHVGYELPKSMLSPDGKFGVIFPKLFRFGDSPDENFLVAVQAHEIIGIIEDGDPYFRGKNHGALSAYWAPDSSAILAINEGKWSPESMVLVELRDGRIVRQTELVRQVWKMFAPDIAKAEKKPVKDVGIGAMGEIHVSWERGKAPKLHLSCEGETNPKDFPGQSRWQGRLEAVWNLQQKKWTSQHVTRISFRQATKEVEEQ